MALLVEGNQCAEAQDFLPDEENRKVVSDLSSIVPISLPIKSANTEEFEFPPFHSNVGLVVQVQENDVPLSRKVQNLQSSQDETNKKKSAFEAEQESAKATHLQKLEALRAADAETHTADQSNIVQLQAANQIKIDAIHEDQLVAEKKFKTLQAKIEALGEENRALVAQLTSFFESEAAVLNSSNTKEGAHL